VKPNKILTTRQTAQALGIGLRHVLTLLYEGKLPGARKNGRKWAIPTAAVESRLKAREQAL
jgi:excisionase family DNA binding protein